MIKYATALRLGTAEAEAILRRFTRGNLQHPTYRALAELGKAVKTTFLRRDLHLLQLCPVYVNTLMIQCALAERAWWQRMQAADFRALSPLIYSHVNPCGRLELDMSKRLPIETKWAA